MTEPTIDRTDAADDSRLNRRGFLGATSGLGVTILAGCSTQSDGGTDSGDSDGDGGTSSGETAGTFRLLISDQPVAIDEFDSLDVSFDRARIFPTEEEDDEGAETEDANETETDEESPEMNETESGDEENASETDETNEEEPEPTESGGDDAEETEMDESEGKEANESDGDGGFSIIDLGGATVDLTQVVGDKAIGVFEGELEAGRYSKIELYASDVEGIVDGETADVKIPSGKLQIVKPFEITPDEPVSFVFDINVVKKGNTGEYNLLPVISESGVAGKDVDVEEVGEDGEGDGDGGDEAMNETDGGTNETGGSMNGSDGETTDAGGNETTGGTADTGETAGDESGGQ